MTAPVDTIQSSSLHFDAGLELLTTANVVSVDLSSDFDADGSSVKSDVRALIHRTCDLRISTTLPWGSARVRPWIEITGDDGVPYRTNLGVFVLTTPERSAFEAPATYQVQGYDLLAVLNCPYGTSYSAPAGSVVLTVISSLLTASGIASRVSQAAITSTLTSAMTWPLDQENTWLLIINDLLKQIGYSSLWIDRDGYARAQPLVLPASQSPIWEYSTDSAKPVVAEERTLGMDLFDAANKLIFVREDDSLTTWAEGAGIYTVTNQSDGPTSIDSRGRTITKVVKLPAVSQAALVAQGVALAEQEKRPVAALAVSVVPNPVHWHEDVVTFTDSKLGVSGKWAVTEWEMQLSGADMTLRMEGV